VSADKRKAVLSGELIRADKAPLKWVAQVVLVQEQRTAPVTRPPEQVAATLAVPGTTLLPLPALQGGWVSKGRSVVLELREGARTVWQDTQMPRNTLIQLRDRRYRLNATEAGNQVRVELVEVPGAASPSGN
jgi:hypothetical protein